MKELEELEGGTERRDPAAVTQGTASDEMCTFLVVNISSLQLIPINMIAYRSQCTDRRTRWQWPARRSWRPVSALGRSGGVPRDVQGKQYKSIKGWLEIETQFSVM